MSNNSDPYLKYELVAIQVYRIMDNRPDIVIVNKHDRKRIFVDFAILLDDNLGKTYRKKYAKYQEQAMKSIIYGIYNCTNKWSYQQVELSTEVSLNISINTLYMIQKAILLLNYYYYYVSECS